MSDIQLNAMLFVHMNLLLEHESHIVFWSFSVDAFVHLIAAVIRPS